MSEYSDSAKGFEMGEKAKTRPDFITNDHLEFLDELRESGVTNMFGARPYIQRRFKTLTTEQSAAVLSYWMKTFGEDER